MGSIQEMPSTEVASESRDVEMHDREGADEGVTDAIEAPSQAKIDEISDTSRPEEPHHVSNGHLTPDRKVGNGASSSPENHGDQPLPSVEKDDDGSPSTAAAEHEKTPESERREAIQSSPAKSRHQNSASASAPANVQTSAESIKLEKDIARLNEVLEEISAQAAQKILKDKWRFFLFDQYDESHISFILRAGFKNANPRVIEKVLQDKSLFQGLLLDVASRKPVVIEKVITNATVSQLLHHVPQRVLDEALAERLKTVSAKQLISWLARADRLGYKIDDIIDEDDESVVPRAESIDVDMAEVFEVEPAPRFASTYRDPLLAEQEKNLAAQHMEKARADAARHLQQQQQPQPYRPPPQNRLPDGQRLSCPDCHVEFPTTSGYTYHTTKKPCKKVPPVASSKWWCENCVQGFTTKQGMDYHKLKGVCTSQDIAPPTPSEQLRREAASSAQHRPPPAPVSSQPQVHIPSVPRPSFTSQPPPSQSTPATSHTSSSYAQPSQSQQQSRPQVTIQRPPLHTPAAASSPSVSTPGPRKQAPPSDVRQSPSELSADRLAALNRELQDADDRYQQQIDDIPSTYTEAERTARLVSLKNANASRKSQIRKAHGVSLRLREKDKLARKAAGVTPPGKSSEHRSSMTSMTSHSTPTSTPPVSSFSPINTPPRTGPSSSDYGHPGNPPHPSQASSYGGPSNPPHPSEASRYNPSPVPSTAPTSSRPSYTAAATAAQMAATSSYRPPPLNASILVQNRYSPHDPNTLSHALERTGTRPSGFGVLRVQDLVSNPAPPNPNKRRRSPSDEGRPVPPRTSAGPSASTGYFAPNLSDQNRPKQDQAQANSGRAEGAIRKAGAGERVGDTTMTDAPAPKPRNTQATAIEILSSSDSDSDGQARKPNSNSNGLHPTIRHSALASPPQTAKPKEHEQSERNGEAESGENGKKEEEGGDPTDSDSSDHETSSRRASRPGTSSSSTRGRKGFMAKRGGKH